MAAVVVVVGDLTFIQESYMLTNVGKSPSCDAKFLCA